MERDLELYAEDGLRRDVGGRYLGRDGDDLERYLGREVGDGLERGLELGVGRITERIVV